MSEEISDEVAETASALINELKGIYINPEFITREKVAQSIKLLSLEQSGTNAAIALGPYNGAVEIITKHDDMPEKVEWAGQVAISGLEDPLWVTYVRQFGIDVEETKLYWMRERHD